MALLKQCKLKNLVYYEQINVVNSAIKWEKQLKNWHRKWKINLIESMNPNWKDLSINLGMIDAEINSTWQSFLFIRFINKRQIINNGDKKWE